MLDSIRLSLLPWLKGSLMRPSKSDSKERMNSIGAMQLIDALDPGGKERVAVNIANALPIDRYRSFLCTTRCDGLLENELSATVGRLRLARRWRFQWEPLRRLQEFIRENHIQILHAHGPSLLMASLASLSAPHPKVIWHNHSGTYEMRRPNRALCWLTRRADAVIAVSQRLANWSMESLGVPAERVWYIPNFIAMKPCSAHAPPLPGRPSSRIVCVANIRPPKDPFNLIQAMDLIRKRFPEAHLCLIGAPEDQEYAARLEQEITERNLYSHISLLGSRSDIPDVLASSAIGVLSSKLEGMPLSLIEYGMAKLPVVATRVGQVPDMLDEGQAGILVPPGDPQALAEGLCSLLESQELRTQLAAQFHRRVLDCYSPQAIMNQIMQVYEMVLSPNS